MALSTLSNCRMPFVQVRVAGSYEKTLYIVVETEVDSAHTCKLSAPTHEYWGKNLVGSTGNLA